MCVCVSVYAHLYVCDYSVVCRCVSVYVCMSAHTYLYVYEYSVVCVGVCVCMCA